MHSKVENERQGNQLRKEVVNIKAVIIVKIAIIAIMIRILLVTKITKTNGSNT